LDLCACCGWLWSGSESRERDIGWVLEMVAGVLLLVSSTVYCTRVSMLRLDVLCVAESGCSGSAVLYLIASLLPERTNKSEAMCEHDRECGTPVEVQPLLEHLEEP